MDPAFAQPLIFGAILAMLAFVLDRRERGRHEETHRRIDALTERVNRFEERIDRELAGVRAEFSAELAEVRAEVRAELAEVRAEVRAELGDFRAEVRADMGALRSDLTQVALALRIVPRPQTG